MIISPSIDAFLGGRAGLDTDAIVSFKKMGVTSYMLMKEVTKAHLQIAGLDVDQQRQFEAVGCLLVSRAADRAETPPDSFLDGLQSSRHLCFLQLAMRAYRGSHSVQASCCSSITEAVAEDTANQLLATRLELVADLAVAMGAHLASASLQQRACGALVALTTDSWENQQLAGKAGLLKAIKDSLRQHKEKLPTLRDLCNALLGIVTGNCANQEAAHRLGILVDLQEILKRHMTDEHLPKLIVCLFRHTAHCISQASERLAAGIEGPEGENSGLKELLVVIQHAMRQHPESSALQEHAAAAVRSLVVTEDAEGVANRLGLMEDIHRAMRGHQDDMCVQEQCCWALSNLTSSLSESREEAMRLGLLKDVQAAMRLWPKAVTLQEQAMWALLNLTHGHTGLQAEAAEMGLLEDIREAMEPPLSLAETMPEACWAVIRNITRSSRAAQTKAGRLGLLRWKEKSAEAAHNYATAMEQVCWSIKSISTATETRGDRAVSLLEHLKQAMMGMRECAMVQEQGLSALWSLLVADGNCKDAASRLGFVLDIRESMLAHPGNLGVLTQGCWTLSILTYNTATNKALAIRLGLLDVIISAMKRHSVVLVVQEAAVVAIRNVIQGLPDSDIQKILAHETSGNTADEVFLLSDITQAMGAHASATLLNEHGSWLLRHISALNIKEGDYKVSELFGSFLFQMRENMRVLRDSAEVQEHLCHFVWNIARNRTLMDGLGPCSDMKAYVGELGIMADIQAAMRAHRSVLAVQVAAMGAIECLTVSNTHNQELARQLCLNIDIDSTLRRFDPLDSVSNKAALIMHRLASAARPGKVPRPQLNRPRQKGPRRRTAPLPGKHLRFRFGKRLACKDYPELHHAWQRPQSASDSRAGGEAALQRLDHSRDLTFVKEVMLAHAGEVELLNRALRSLSNITCNSSQQRIAACRLGLLEDVAEAMKVHRGRADVQEHGCRAVKFVVSNEWQGQQHAGQAKVIASILYAIQNHRASAAVLNQAFLAITSVVSGHRENQDLAVELGLLSEARLAMRAFISSPEMEVDVLTMLRHLLAGNPSCVAQARRMGLANDVRSVAMSNSKLQHLQKAAARVSMFVSDIPAHIKANGGS